MTGSVAGDGVFGRETGGVGVDLYNDGFLLLAVIFVPEPTAFRTGLFPSGESGAENGVEAPLTF